jgi:hypothetical protein
MSVMPDFLQPRAGLRTRTAVITLWLAGAGGLSSCAHKAPRAFNPPPVAAKAPTPIAPAPEIASPPEVAFEPVVYDFPRQTDSGSQFPPLPPPRPARPPVANIPKPQPAPDDTPSAPVLRLSQILTPEESRRNTQELDQYTESVKKALTRVAGRNLTPEQRDIAQRVQTYLTQAEQARDQDLVTAVNLAKRADLLAKDLVARLP